MAARSEQRNRNESFGRLLSGAVNSIATYEGKTAPAIEGELGALAVVSGKTIQRYKAGYLPPEPRTVEILAEAAVTRGFLGRAWLQRFLHTARYPGADQLLDRLCPAPIVRARAPRVYANLPAPTYSQFVMRAQAFAEVLEGLAARSAAVLIVGLGGQGKTSLAREVADACLKGLEGAPAFDAAVWVSDKDRPGTTNLSTVLDEIARTLDYPGFTQFEYDEKRREVEQLLRKQRVLLIVDNFETVTDGALLSWLLRLPEPSKALITSREYSRAFRNSTMVAELRGMQDAEAQTLIAQRLRMLQLDKKVKDPAEFEPLVAVTGGNPKAIEIALGVVKHERRPLQQVVDDLYAARGELFDDLFARAWSLLDEAARRVLMVMTFFPDSASGEAVAASADVQGYAFDRAVERLTDLALLDIQQADLSNAPRYTLHSLVRVFSRARLIERPSFEEGARDRWVEWYVQLVSQVGYSWKDIHKLDQLDDEQDNLYFVISCTFAFKQYNKVLDLCRGSTYYYHQRGDWDRSSTIYAMRAEAARELFELVEQVFALAYHVQLKSRQGKIQEASNLLNDLIDIEKIGKPQGDSLFEYRHALALYYRAIGDTIKAHKIWEMSMNDSVTYTNHRKISNMQWLGASFLEQQEYDVAKHLFLSSLSEAKKDGNQRGIATNMKCLASADLALGNVEQAERALAEARKSAEQWKDRANLADIYANYAHLHILLNDIPAARAALTKASDLFERLGMRRELAKARAELARLNAEPATLGS